MPELPGPFEFRILGTIEVWRDGRALGLGGRKMRGVLAALVLHADRVVLTERLVAALWGEQPPGTAVAQVHKHVSELRGLLGQECIVRHGGGYRLHIGSNTVDLAKFDEITRSARAMWSAGDAEQAAEQIGTALALWRGDPIADATDELIRIEAPALQERRITALLDWIEMMFVLERHGELVGQLHSLVAQNPFHEKLRGHLMLALYRSGRVAEALAVYRDGRTCLAEELGLDPGSGLQALHGAMLDGDASLERLEYLNNRSTWNARNARKGGGAPSRLIRHRRSYRRRPPTSPAGHARSD